MKKLYSEITLNEDELLEASSNRIELKYYKISNKDEKNVNTYGLEIIKKEYFDKEKTEETKKIINLTTNENTINNVLYLLSKNTVTPIGLHDALQEVL